MLGSRLVKYIKNLSVRDRKKFADFVSSPYFNKRQESVQLLEALFKMIDASEEVLAQSKLLAALYPGVSLKSQVNKLQKEMSGLKKLFHQFMACQQLQKENFYEDIFVMEAAFEQNRFDLLENQSKRLKKKLTTYKYRDSRYHFASYRHDYLWSTYQFEFVERKKTELLQQRFNNLNHYYLIEVLKNAYRMKTNMLLVNVEYDFQFLEEVIHYIKNNWNFYKQEPLIRLYFTLLVHIQNIEEFQDYQKLKSLLGVSSIDDSSQKDLYEFLSNFCIKKINAGEEEYQKELFSLYNEGLKREILFLKGTLLEWDYKNIVTLGCYLGEFEWTEKFIKNYKDKLPASVRENAYNYNLAYFHYCHSRENNKSYDEALSILSTVKFTDITYHQTATLLLLSIYYALDNTEAALSLIETFRLFVLRNKKMTIIEKKGYTHFLRLAKKLISLKSGIAIFSMDAFQQKLSKISIEIENTPNVTNKPWLIKRCTELKILA